MRPSALGRICVFIAALAVIAPVGGLALQRDDPASSPVLPWTWSLWTYREHANITVGEDVLRVEIADDSSFRSRGLSYRDGLEPGTGMLFVYPDEGERSFWMRGMRFCLDIVWIGDGEIVGAAESVCPEPGVSDANLTSYPSPVPVRFVLEVPAGWLDEREYGAGTPVDLGAVEA